MLSDFSFFIIMVIIYEVGATILTCIIVDNVFWDDDDDWSEGIKK